MTANEYSDRALSLTEDIISMNPAHYTVWLYRAKIVQEMGKDIVAELAWLEGVSKRSLKNYQIWHHRQTLMSKLPNPPQTEPAFLSRILTLDSKNYHVWTYRQWLVRHFDLFDSASELAAVNDLLLQDVRNNSAWNHRWFLRFGRDDQKQRQQARHLGSGSAKNPHPTITNENLIDEETIFTQSKILLAPQNQSPWNYLRALYHRSGRPLTDLCAFAEQFITRTQIQTQTQDSGESGAGEDADYAVQSSHALDLLADIYAQLGDVERAKWALRILGEVWDPIRKGYWNWRAGLLEKGKGKGEMEEKGEETKEDLS